MVRKRIVLDTNVWRRIVDANAGDALVRTATRADAKILAAPTVAYEALRISQQDVRESVLRELINRRWLRLMPDAYSECMELLAEIRRVRPDALRTKPDMARFAQLKASWTNPRRGFWQRIRTNPAEELAAFDFGGQRQLLEAGRRQAARRREEMNGAAKWEHVPLDQIRWIPEGEFMGWDGHPVEGWRVEGYATFSFALPQHGSAYRDWLEPFCDVDALLPDRASWTTSGSEKLG